MISLKA
jgi:plasmid stabilization system protein ParE